MPASLDLTSAAALRDYVEDFADGLISQGFYGHATADFSTPHENVKGEKILTLLSINDLARRWAKTFTPSDNTIKFKPKTLRTTLAKVELQIYPQDFESSYLGMKRKKGQGMDIPFEGVIMQKVMQRLAQEFDIAHLNGKKAATPTSNDLFKQLFDGLFEIFSEMETEGHAPLALPSGGLDVNNMLDYVQDMIDGINPAYNEGDLEIFMPNEMGNLYYNALVKKYPTMKPPVQRNGKVKFYETEKADGRVVILPSWKTNRIVCSAPGNFHHGFDDQLDSSQFNFENNKRAIDFWMDFKFGVQVAIPEESALMMSPVIA